MKSDQLAGHGMRMLATIACVLVLQGCNVNPVKRWDPPAAAEVPNYSMDYAIAYAHKARHAYQEHIDEQSLLSSNLSNGLIGLGGAIAALATFGAHKDAVIGAGLLGGTAYALGNWNYSKQRQLIYQAGTEGINCAIRAVTPLYMSNDELAALNSALGNIEVLVPQVLQSIERVEALQTKYKITDEEVRRQIANARLIVDNANKALVSGRQVATKVRRAGTELVNAVDRIDAAVSKAALDTLPDLTAVPKVVGGLAGFAGTFAPGADAVITEALKRAAGPTAQGGVNIPRLAPEESDELNRALDDMRAQSARLAAATSQVAARVSSYDAALNTDGLADCGIGNVANPLRAVPDTITFSSGADQTKRVIVSGGVKRYSSVALENLPEGLSVRDPVPFDSTFDIVATKSLKTKGTFNVMLVDSSNPQKSIPLVIKVDGADGTGRPAATNATDTPATIDTIADALLGHKFEVPDSGGSIPFTVISTPVNKAVAPPVIDVTVRCDKTPAASLDAAAVRKVLAAVKTAQGFDVGAALKDIGQADTRLNILPVPNCVKLGAPAAQGGVNLPPGAAHRARLSGEDIRVMQRNLCLPHWLQTGKWLSQSQRALEEWRRKTGASTRKGEPASAEEASVILQASATTVTQWCAKQ